MAHRHPRPGPPGLRTATGWTGLAAQLAAHLAAQLAGVTLAASAAAAQPAPAAPAPTVQRTGSGWKIQPQGSSLAALAQALAAASGSRLDGPLAALQAAPPPRGQAAWRLTSLDQAWATLLDGRVSHARQCRGQGVHQHCTVWLVPAPAAAAPAQTPAPAPPRTPMADPPGLFPTNPDTGA